MCQAFDVGGREQGVTPAPVGDQLRALGRRADEHTDVQGEPQWQVWLGVDRERVEVGPGDQRPGLIGDAAEVQTAQIAELYLRVGPQLGNSVDVAKQAVVQTLSRDLADLS